MKTGDEPMTLAQLLDQEVVLPIDEVLFLASETAMRLARLHSTHRIHGELTPGAIRINPSFTQNRGPKEIQPVELRSNSGSHIAAPESFEDRLYLSPESRDGRSTDERSDIYSLGCVLCTCISGAPPFLHKADRISTNYKDLISERLAGVVDKTREGRWLQQIIEWCVAPEAQDRYRSAQQIVRDVNLIKLNRPPVGPRPKQESMSFGSQSIWKRFRRQFRRNLPYTMGAIAGAAIGLTGLLGLSMLGLNVLLFGGAEPASPATNGCPMQLEVLWNKPADQYKLWDQFAYKILPHENAYVYSFYVKDDKVSTFYPSTAQKSNLVDTNGISVDSFNDEVVLLVDENNKGLLVTIGIPASYKNEFEIVRKDEYSTSQVIPDKLQLTISAKTLFNRIQQLREHNPRSIVIIQKAPSATKK